jgi:predicted Fe-Mo cluster-binding NifX family protein
MKGGESMRKRKIAVPTAGHNGLDDNVSEVFGRANAFTIIDIQGNTVEQVKVIENPAITYDHGAGPIAVKMLLDLGVNVVVAEAFGVVVSTLLDQFNVRKIKVSAGTLVKDAIQKKAES